jgi:hypothetical protein
MLLDNAAILGGHFAYRAAISESDESYCVVKVWGLIYLSVSLWRCGCYVVSISVKRTTISDKVNGDSETKCQVYKARGLENDTIKYSNKANAPAI